jgi:cobalt-zinc-cadmium efflux system outer membrane protein
MDKIIVLLCGAMFAVAGFGASEPLTLERALELARQNSPGLRAARLETQAAEKAVAASGRWKNPKLEFDAEGIGGDLDGFGDTEYTIGIAQTFERGGKRKGERQVAEQSVGVALQAEAAQELALLAEVRLAFIELLSQQETGKVRAEQQQLGEAFVQVAKSRYEAGGCSELEVVQAELALEEIILSQTCCFGDLAAARIKLASLIGIPEPELAELAGAYYELDAIGASALPESHPSLRRWDAQISTVRAEAALAKAQDATDITLGAGYRYEAASDVNTFVFGVSMPLNFVRSGAAAQAAGLLQADALATGRAEARRRLQQDLSVLAARYDGAKQEAEITHDRLLPKAEVAYNLSKSGYEAGRFSWLELIAAQQHLADIRIRYIEALKDAHLARAEITKFMKEGN